VLNHCVIGGGLGFVRPIGLMPTEHMGQGAAAAVGVMGGVKRDVP
jgi:hypothetical protein